MRLRQCLAADWASLNIMTRLACLVPLPPVSISFSPSVTQANGHECALDGVGGPQVSPVLCGEVVEGEVVSRHVSGHRGVPLTDLQPGAVGQHDPQGRVGPRHRPDAHGGEGGTIRFRLDPDLLSLGA